MKIEDNRDNTRKFKELVVGDVFEYNGDICMKTKEIYTENETSISCIVYNIVFLSYNAGTPEHLDDDVSVILLDDATLVLN